VYNVRPIPPGVHPLGKDNVSRVPLPGHTPPSVGYQPSKLHAAIQAAGSRPLPPPRPQAPPPPVTTTQPTTPSPAPKRESAKAAAKKAGGRGKQAANTASAPTGLYTSSGMQTGYNVTNTSYPSGATAAGSAPISGAGMAKYPTGSPTYSTRGYGRGSGTATGTTNTNYYGGYPTTNTPTTPTVGSGRGASKSSPHMSYTSTGASYPIGQSLPTTPTPGMTVPQPAATPTTMSQQQQTKYMIERHAAGLRAAYTAAASAAGINSNTNTNINTNIATTANINTQQSNQAMYAAYASAQPTTAATTGGSTTQQPNQNAYFYGNTNVATHGHGGVAGAATQQRTMASYPGMSPTATPTTPTGTTNTSTGYYSYGYPTASPTSTASYPSTPTSAGMSLSFLLLLFTISSI
jgi:hypothetical protein